MATQTPKVLQIFMLTPMKPDEFTPPTYRSGLTSINKNPTPGAATLGGAVLGRGRFGPKTGQVFEGFVGKSFLGGGTWAKWELQPTSNGFELIQVDDCDAGEVPGSALVG
jgi:hypothetical protein